MFSLLFDDKRYDLAKVGRYKYNKKLGVSDRIMDTVAAENIIDPRTGEVLIEEGEMISERKAFEIENSGVKVVNVLNNQKANVKVVGNHFVEISNFLSLEGLAVTGKVHYPALMEILNTYTEEDEIRAQIKAQKKALVPKNIIVDDIVASFSYILNLGEGIGSTDDIDHLGNRRIRSVGELLQNQFRIGLSRMERVVRERMTIQEMEAITPQALINIRPVTASIKEFWKLSVVSVYGSKQSSCRAYKPSKTFCLRTGWSIKRACRF